MKAQTIMACLAILGITSLSQTVKATNTAAALLNSTAIERSIKDSVPLYFLDGKKISVAEFKKLNPNNLESVTVLKDQKDLAKYGDEGKNGVVILVSKKAKK